MVKLTNLSVKDITKDFIRDNYDIEKERKQTNTNPVYIGMDFYTIADSKSDFFETIHTLKDACDARAKEIIKKKSYKNCTYKFILEEQQDWGAAAPYYDLAAIFTRDETDFQVVARLQSRDKTTVRRRIKKAEKKANQEREDAAALARLKKSHTPEELIELLSD